MESFKKSVGIQRHNHTFDHEHLCTIFSVLVCNNAVYYFSPYMKYTRKYIHSVQCTNLFFLSDQNCQPFYSKINDSGMVGTTAFSSSRFAVRVFGVPIIFTIYL